MASNTPTLDKFGLHSFGGYCTCFSHPYSVCTVCERSREAKRRWDALTPANRKKALEELDDAYPRTSNQDGR